MENNQRSSSNPHLAKPVLCDGFLIPMTDFVLRINEIEKEIDQFFDSWRMKQLRIIENYAKFLKQPLKLEMFVPCDEDGNVLAEPKIPHTFASENSDLYIEKWKSETEIFNKAKEKVLFENASIREINYFVNHFQTIEDLLQSRGGKTLKLTQTALDSIFGKTGA